MFFSIITVCYNCKAELEPTICSVLSQTVSDYEYLIIDGASVDGTAELAEQYAKNHSNFSVVSEHDNGIYDAMNKGTNLSHGDYILFLNAGDIFHSNNVLEEAKNAIMKEKLDIYYGDVSKGGNIIKQDMALTVFRLVFLERMLCHQSIFAKSDQCKKHPFDLSLKICADRDWLIQSLMDKATAKYIPNLVVSDYDTTGISSNYSLYQGESLRIGEKYGGKMALYFIRIKREIGKMIGHKYF